MSFYGFRSLQIIKYEIKYEEATTAMVTRRESANMQSTMMNIIDDMSSSIDCILYPQNVGANIFIPRTESNKCWWWKYENHISKSSIMVQWMLNFDIFGLQFGIWIKKGSRSQWGSGSSGIFNTDQKIRIPPFGSQMAKRIRIPDHGCSGPPVVPYRLV